MKVKTRSPNLVYFLCLPFWSSFNPLVWPSAPRKSYHFPSYLSHYKHNNKRWLKVKHNTLNIKFLITPKDNGNEKILHLFLKCDLPTYLPYDSRFLCRRLQDQIRYKKFRNSLYLSFFLATYFWVFVLATH